MAGYKLFYQFTGGDHDQGGANISLMRPTVLGLVETNGNEMKRPERMEYFHLPKSENYPLDLNQDSENYKPRPEDFYKVKLGAVAFTIMDKDLFKEYPKDIKNVKMREKRYEVITDRCTLTELMQAPYKFGPNNKSQYNLHIAATHFKRKLFLRRIDSDKAYVWSLDEVHYFKFKQYCFSDDPHIEPNPNVPIDESKQLYGVFRSKIKNIDLIYSAELCGIQSCTKLHNVNDEVEVGQSRFIHTKVMKDGIRNWMNDYRTSILWTKAYLTGSNDIFVAFKTNGGVVAKPVRHLLAQQIPINQKWSPNVYNRFMYNFITKVIAKVQGIDCPYTCYEFVFRPEKECVEFKIHHGPSDLSFLSEAFIEYLKKIVICK